MSLPRYKPDLMAPGAMTPHLGGHPGFAPEFIEHRGIRVLRLDYTGLAPDDLPEAFQRAGRVIAAEPAGSLIILTVLDSRFNAQAAEALKRYAAANGPFVRRSAIVAIGFWKVVVTSIKLHGREDLVLFENQAEALDWLVDS
jgi:hypothetical protein